jgi:uncharacterized protein YndB with AHSA1/START domain
MINKLTAKASIIISAPTAKVWQALTEPAQIKEYRYGADVVSDWEKGSSITYKGAWQGREYEDKATIVDIVPERILHTTYWSAMSGKEDKPENYANVIYGLKAEGEGTFVIIAQDNIDSEEQVKQMEQNWGTVLERMKMLLEK